MGTLSGPKGVQNREVPLYIYILGVRIRIMLATFLRDVTATFLRDVTATFLSVTDTYIRTHIMRIDRGLESSLRSQLYID